MLREAIEGANKDFLKSPIVRILLTLSFLLGVIAAAFSFLAIVIYGVYEIFGLEHTNQISVMYVIWLFLVCLSGTSLVFLVLRAASKNDSPH